MLGELTVGHLGTEVKFVKQCYSKEYISYKSSTADTGCKNIKTNLAFYTEEKKETIGKTAHCATANIKKPPLQCLLQGMILFSFLPG